MDKNEYLQFIQHRIGMHNLINWGCEDTLLVESLPDGNIRISGKAAGHPLQMTSVEQGKKKCNLILTDDGGKEILNLQECPTNDIQKHLVAHLERGGEYI